MSQTPSSPARSELSSSHGANRSDRPRNKLRSCCDRCTSRKIRCNKQRPTCAKCKSLEVKCVYSPYRWKGRPGVAKTTASPAPSPSSIFAAEWLSAPDGLYGPSTVLPFNNEDLFTELEIPSNGGCVDTSLDLEALTAWDSSTSTIAQECSQEPQSPLCSTDALFGSNTPRQDEEDTPLPVLDFAVPVVLDRQTARCKTSSVDVCVETVLEILRELHCLPPENDVLSTDQALQINRRALQKMSLVLSSGSHTRALDANLGLLLYTTCSRMLTRYKTILDCICQKGPYNQETRHSLLTHASTPHERLRFEPVQFGGFDVDLPTARRLNLQLLLSELRRTERFLSALTDHIERGAHRQTSRSMSDRHRAADEMGPSCPATISEAFHDFLEKSITELCAEIQAFCG